MILFEFLWLNVPGKHSLSEPEIITVNGHRTRAKVASQSVQSTILGESPQSAVVQIIDSDEDIWTKFVMNITLPYSNCNTITVGGRNGQDTIHVQKKQN